MDVLTAQAVGMRADAASQNTGSAVCSSAPDLVQAAIDGERIAKAFLHDLGRLYVDPDHLCTLVSEACLPPVDPASQAKLRGLCRCLQKRLEKCLLPAGR